MLSRGRGVSCGVFGSIRDFRPGSLSLLRDPDSSAFSVHAQWLRLGWDVGSHSGVLSGRSDLERNHRRELSETLFPFTLCLVEKHSFVLWLPKTWRQNAYGAQL